MNEKTLLGYLLITVSLLFSCSPEHTSENKSGISMETISIITFVLVGIAILAAYPYKKK
ncbi:MULTISPECIES: hypothetical protein [Chryseobacterium]|jgi:hypothetical protein|uniref:Lipoprotein n=1 Tax=Chryseobacterium rhizosphaerae TaxID=395937 RepID=A0AAE4C6E0_9FLAO|nr:MULTISPECIES: hypothetical protein [Chryseobacterium]MBL3546514.1 hypothetical protein [Chryseobacterium sp. KMC2]MDR6528560.1 hypothetical protein [Chryseobacterium rhizosphaerae]MDR6547421.1 hypothetical protein [Chryseobacterium rhizosphaerae]